MTSRINQILIEKLEVNSKLIEEWFLEKFSKTKPLFYNSIDLRHSGFKIAPVDNNCFPAGFNNLSSSSRIEASNIVKNFLDSNFPNLKKILIIPESHTRNLYYLENLLSLAEIIAKSKKIEVAIGTLISEIDTNLEIDLPSGRKIILQKIIKNQNKIITQNNFEPDLIILNNDLTSGLPEIFLNLEQIIIPSPKLGWYQRTKSNHFDNYDQLAKELASLIDLDYWLISTMHRKCWEVNFKEQVGIECLANYVDELIAKIGDKYRHYAISDEPYCYIKADNGTYGMAIMTVKSGENIREINKKERNKMDVIKGSVPNSRIIIQEGIKTIDRINGINAEPMIYLINGQVVSNLFRANSQRDQTNNLNSQGMSFYDLTQLGEQQIELGSAKNDIVKIYSLIARLSTLAAAREKY